MLSGRAPRFGDRHIQSSVSGTERVTRIRYAWSRCFIGAAIEVHRLKGPGLVEPIYRKCVRRECKLRNIPTRYELIVPIEYKSFVFEEPLRLDLLIDDCLIVELKAVVRNHRSTTESIDQKPL